MEYDGKDCQEYPLMGWSEYLAAKEPIAQTGGQNDGHCLQSGVVLHQGCQLGDFVSGWDFQFLKKGGTSVLLE